MGRLKSYLLAMMENEIKSAQVSDFNFLHSFWLLILNVLIAILAILLVSLPAQAIEWRNLWMRSDQQAAKQLSRGLPEVAAQQFTDPFWRGMALYQAGDYTGAADAFAQSNDINANYNRGNALAKAGQLEQAAQIYRDVLAQKPAHTDASANLALIESLLQQQHQFSEQEQDNQQSGQPDDALQQHQNDTDEATADNSEQTDNAETGETQESLQNGQNSNSAANQQNNVNGDAAQPIDQANQTYPQGIEGTPQDMDTDPQNMAEESQRQDQYTEEQALDHQSGEAANEGQFAEKTDQMQHSDHMEATDSHDADPLQQHGQQLEEHALAPDHPSENADESDAVEHPNDMALSDDDLQPQDEIEAKNMGAVQQDMEEQLYQQDKDQEVLPLTELPADKANEPLLVSKATNQMRSDLEQELEQWLRQIPDNPSGLLRRKFMIEHDRRQQEIQ